MDETSVNLWMRKSKVWMHRSDDLKQVLHKRNFFITVYGAISTHRDQLFSQVCDRTNGENTIKFLKAISKKYNKHDEEVFLVLDQHPSHKSGYFNEAIVDLPFKVLLLPPYSSHLNPIEHVWGTFKKHWRNHICEHSGAIDDVNLPREV
jgi:transposase